MNTPTKKKKQQKNTNINNDISSVSETKEQINLFSSPDNISVEEWTDGIPTNILEYINSKIGRNPRRYHIKTVLGLFDWAREITRPTSTTMFDSFILDAPNKILDLEHSSWFPPQNIEAISIGTRPWLDGNGCTIKNVDIPFLRVVKPKKQPPVGFIGSFSRDLSNPYIKDVTIEDITILSNGSHMGTGGLVGEFMRGAITGCKIQGDIQIIAERDVGGIVGVFREHNPAVNLPNFPIDTRICLSPDIAGLIDNCQVIGNPGSVLSAKIYRNEYEDPNGTDGNGVVQIGKNCAGIAGMWNVCISNGRGVSLQNAGIKNCLVQDITITGDAAPACIVGNLNGNANFDNNKAIRVNCKITGTSGAARNDMFSDLTTGTMFARFKPIYKDSPHQYYSVFTRNVTIDCTLDNTIESQLMQEYIDGLAEHPETSVNFDWVPEIPFVDGKIVVDRPVGSFGHPDQVKLITSDISYRATVNGIYDTVVDTTHNIPTSGIFDRISDYVKNKLNELEIPFEDSPLFINNISETEDDLIYLINIELNPKLNFNQFLFVTSNLVDKTCLTQRIYNATSSESNQNVKRVNDQYALIPIFDDGEVKSLKKTGINTDIVTLAQYRALEDAMAKNFELLANKIIYLYENGTGNNSGNNSNNNPLKQVIYDKLTAALAEDAEDSSVNLRLRELLTDIKDLFEYDLNH